MLKFLRETKLIFMSGLVRTRRNPMWIMITLFQPILYLLLFAPLLDKLQMPGVEQDNSLNLFVPGLLVMIALFGAGFSGFNIIEDLRGGVIERLRVTPASRLALLLGMMLTSVVVFLVQCALLVAVATLMGLRADFFGLIILFIMMAPVALMMTSFSYGLALIFRDEGTLAGTLSTLTQPLLLLSGVLLPLTLAPKFMRTLADLNPFSHLVDAARALVDGHLSDSSIPLSFAIIITLALAALLWATRIFQRAMA